MNKFFLCFFGVLLCMSIVSANGLSIVGQSLFEVNKTVGEQEIFTFALRNDEPFSFYNISFEENSHIDMKEILELPPGSEINVTVNVTGNNEYLGDIRVIGLYESNLGLQNKTYDVEVDWEDGLSLCDVTLIKGDSINWINFVNDDIEISAPYSMFGGTNIIPIGSAKKYSFPSPEVFSYSFMRRGYDFTNVCEIIVLSDVGKINNPDLNAILSLDLKTDYPPTFLDVIFFENNYTIDVYESNEGAFLIKNIGSNLAKNINLESKWFTFNKNNFDLLPEKTTSISYTIRPNIFHTNETNKTHSVLLKIDGNFEPVDKEFNIYVPYATITDDGYTTGKSLLEMIRELCEQNPNDQLCGGEVRTVFVSENDSEFNVTLQQGKFNSWVGYQFEQGDKMESSFNLLKEGFYLLEQKVNSTEKESVDTRGLLAELIEMEKEKNNITTVLAVLFFTLIFTGLLVFIGLYIRRKNKFKNISQWHYL